MNEIQEYLLEHSDHIHQNHYVILMDLCNKIQSHVNMNRRVDVFDYSSNDFENDVNFFMMVMSKLNLEIPANIIDTDLHFPTSLTKHQRQAIHIFINMANLHRFNYVCSESYGYDQNRRICIHFSKEFLQSM